MPKQKRQLKESKKQHLKCKKSDTYKNKKESKSTDESKVGVQDQGTQVGPLS
jgi:hypothetical protein